MVTQLDQIISLHTAVWFQRFLIFLVRSSAQSVPMLVEATLLV
jgi:hypothetical protein